MPKKKNQAIKDLHLDKPTSHGGWPDGHPGSYNDPDTPVNVHIANYLEQMGLLERPPHARLSELYIRKLIREAIRVRLLGGE